MSAAWAVTQDAYRAARFQTYRACIEAQARDELRLECVIGSLREAFATYRAGHGDATPKAFVEMLERSNAPAWQDRLDVIFTDLEGAL